MTKVYYRGSCNSSKKVFRWFRNHDLSVKREKVSQLSREDLVKVLSLSNSGFEDVLKQLSRVAQKHKYHHSILNSMTFNQAVDYLREYTDILQTPIVLDGDKLMIGYNEDEIRQFLPKKYRNKMF